jgi:chaperone required for assembly of F1-ATPase
VKRFWTEARAVEAEGGWSIMLDGRPLKTPARALLVLPKATLSDTVVQEWNAAPETVDPRAMPMTGLANAAVDRVAPDKAGFAAGLARYADNPAKLVDRQAARWDPLLAWARRRYDVDFAVTSGIIHVDQPPPTVERLAHEISILDAYRLAALSPIITIGGSLVTALAMVEGVVGFDEAWAAISLDEEWQIEQWGDDAEAVAALANKRRDVAAAVRFIELLN